MGFRDELAGGRRGGVGEILTLDAKMKRLASSFVQVIRCGAHVLAGATPGHALKHQALIRPDYPGRRVVRQYLVLKATRGSVFFSDNPWNSILSINNNNNNNSRERREKKKGKWTPSSSFVQFEISNRDSRYPWR